MHSFLAGTRERGNDECVFICNFVIKSEFFFFFAHRPRNMEEVVANRGAFIFKNALRRNDMERPDYGLGRAFYANRNTYDGLRDYRQIVMVSKSVWWKF